MKLLQTIVSGASFRAPEHNPRRLAVLDDLLAVATRKTADLVLLPGGYLTVERKSHLSNVVGEVERRANNAKLAIAYGVDLPESTSGKNARAPQLPYFGVVSGTATGGPWQQTSSTGANAADVTDDDVPGANRVVSIAGKKVGVLICGELFSWWARESFADLELDLALDLGHHGMSTGVTPAMENIARNGKCAVAHAHHVSSRGNQSLHFVRADGVRESIPLNDCDWVGDHDFWIAWCLRTI